MYPRWLWRSFALPGIIWLIVLFIVPFYAVTAVAFGSVNPILLTPEPIWNPLKWNIGWVSNALSRLQPGHDLWVVFVRTCEYVGFSLALCIAIGYPIAYYIARHTTRTKSLLLILLILPLWVSYLMRMLAWVNLLAPDGYVNRFLMFTHVISSPYGFLDGKPLTVILALVYGYIPYLILPLYASLDRIDKSLHRGCARPRCQPDADVPSRDAAAVARPASWAGACWSHCRCSATTTRPTSSRALPRRRCSETRSTCTSTARPQPTIGAALTLLMSIFLVVLMAYYMVTVARQTKELRA